jgi:Cu(I)/Ag(I) efflux system membrane fusion protein
VLSKPTSSKAAWAKNAKIIGALLFTFAVGLAIGVPIGTSDEGAPAASADDAKPDKETIWTCSMHPQIKLPEAGKCPICGMALIPLETEGDDEHAHSDTHLVMSDRAKKLANIETTPVRRADASVELRLLGRLAYDETKVRTVTSWTDGRIDRLFVSAVGEKIKRGQVIASQYSPEVYAARADLVQAKLQVDRLGKGLEIAKTAAKATLRSARTRLKLLGVRPMKSKNITSSTSPPRNVAITAKYAGTVVEQMVHEGAYVKAGTPIYRTADLEKVWAQLDAYEGDLAKVQLEQRVTLIVSSFPGESFEGQVAFIDPIVDPRTRTAQIRVEVSNDDGRLSPGMFADAILHAENRDAQQAPLVIPDSAALFTGMRSLVYVELPKTAKPTYEARVVQLGPRAGDVYPVIAGLKEGERVVTRGAFVIDSDLQIRGGKSMMSQDDDHAREALRPVRVTDKFMKGFGRVMGPYLDLQEKLAADDKEGSAKAMAELAQQAAGFDPRSPEEARAIYLKMRDKIAGEARQGVKSDDIETMRRAFGAIGEQLVIASKRFGNPTSTPLQLAHCPMAFDNRGADWLQRGKTIANPYFGSQMHSCGAIEDTTESGAHISDELPPKASHSKMEVPPGKRPKKAATPKAAPKAVDHSKHKAAPKAVDHSKMDHSKH